MEDCENGHSVRVELKPMGIMLPHSIPGLTVNSHRRSHLQPGVKTTKWEDRMAKTKKEHAVKKLQTEMKEEKQAEITRCVAY
jgi:hypothetical protein